MTQQPRLTAWIAAFVAAGCGRSGFTETVVDSAGLPDYTSDDVDWADFNGVSAAHQLPGINRPVDLGLLAANATGTPLIEYRINSDPWNGVAAGTSAITSIAPVDTLQFRVSGTVGDAAFMTVTNETTGGTLLDTVRGTVASMVTGSGSTAAPYAAPGTPPNTCEAFLAAFPEQANLDGTYTIGGAASFNAYCDMTTDGGGWRLVARVIGTSTTHVNGGAIGTLTDPQQATTAKLADATINATGFMRARLRIETVGSVYALATTLDLSGAAFGAQNTAAPAVVGPYIYEFRTSTGCTGDCGVAQVPQNMGFGDFCGYRYYASANSPRPGMGCNGNHGKAGSVWIR